MRRFRKGVFSFSFVKPIRLDLLSRLKTKKRPGLFNPDRVHKRQYYDVVQSALFQVQMFAQNVICYREISCACKASINNSRSNHQLNYRLHANQIIDRRDLDIGEIGGSRDQIEELQKDLRKSTEGNKGSKRGQHFMLVKQVPYGNRGINDQNT